MFAKLSPAPRRFRFRPGQDKRRWMLIRDDGQQRVAPAGMNGRAERSRCEVKMGPRGLVASYLHGDLPSASRQAG
jgi:hypothetical protein